MESEKIEKAKKRAGESAADLVEDDMIVGLGTGSTAAYAIKQLGRRVRDNEIEILGIPTSNKSKNLAVKEGIPLTTLETGSPDISIDGADQFDSDLNLIKGGGAAHFREKIIAEFSKKFVVVVDESKFSKNLEIPVPLEVLEPAVPLVRKEIKELGGKIHPRETSKKDGLVVTDNGNPVLDADFGKINGVKNLDLSLSNISGIIEHGLFSKITDEIHIGKSDEVEILTF